MGFYFLKEALQTSQMPSPFIPQVFYQSWHLPPGVCAASLWTTVTMSPPSLRSFPRYSMLVSFSGLSPVFSIHTTGPLPMQPPLPRALFLHTLAPLLSGHSMGTLPRAAFLGPFPVLAFFSVAL